MHTTPQTQNPQTSKNEQLGVAPNAKTHQKSVLEPTTIDELRQIYDCEWLEDCKGGRFSRVTTSPEESAWFCTDCGSLDVDAHEGICNCCGEDC